MIEFIEEPREICRTFSDVIALSMLTVALSRGDDFALRLKGCNKIKTWNYTSRILDEANCSATQKHCHCEVHPLDTRRVFFMLTDRSHWPFFLNRTVIFQITVIFFCRNTSASITDHQPILIQGADLKQLLSRVIVCIRMHTFALSLDTNGVAPFWASEWVQF